VTTSGTYSFSSPESVDLITDAYERISISGSEITEQKIITAQRSINLLLSSIPNKGLNLWTVQQFMINLIPNQASYNMPANTIDIKEANLRQSNRNLGGTAFSSAGGTASNAFSNNPALACTQTAPDGYISYNWNTSGYAISLVGVQSNATLTYTLVFEYSNDDITWTEVGSQVAQSYAAGIIVWFVIPAPTRGTLFRVRETDGETLNIRELYFNTGIYDLIIMPMSRFEYMSISYKNQSGPPSSYYLDKQINPIVNIWPVPTAQYNNLYFTATQAIQDIGQLRNNPQIPARFLEALTAVLAYQLAIKFSPERVPMLKELADQVMTSASKSDVERVPLRIYGNYSQGWAES
jgi:hypothetical protein